MTIDNWIAVAEILSQILIAAATFWLGWRVYRHTVVTAGMQQLSSAITAINELNMTALSSDENLRAIDSLYPDNRPQSLDQIRRRWAAFSALQTHQQLFLAERSGLFPKSTAQRHHTQVLDLLIADPEVLSLALNRGFDAKFAEYCEERARKLHAARAASNPHVA
jgi:hypothetical protein